MRTHPHKYTFEFKNQVLAELDRSGKSVTAFAKERGLRTGLLWDWTAKRRKGKLVPRKTTIKVTPEQKAQALADLASGAASAKELAKRLNISEAAVYWWRKAAKGEHYPSTVKRLKGNGHASAAPAPTTPLDPAFVDGLRDAMIYLRQAKRELMNGIRAGRISEFDQVHLLAMQALNSLQQ